MKNIQKLKFLSVTRAFSSVIGGLPQIALCLVLAATLVAMLPASSQAAMMFDKDVQPDVIFGSGNLNGSFTVDRSNGVEVGLRGKLRYNPLGAPENTFNSNGDGTYSFVAGQAFGQSSSTAVWSFEWSINSDTSSSGRNLDELTYILGIDSDASLATSFTTFDPINTLPFADHSIGDNTTGNGAGAEATDVPGYAALIGNNNVAQNSWKAHWYLTGFDPNVDGNYDFYLEAFDGNVSLARTEIQIIVGDGATAPVPEPATVALLGIGLVGLAGAEVRRRRKKKAVDNS